ncbi:replicative helicase loader/inhibitor [Halalkalibacterium halodurans]|uniref:replicative helicase loader/inhibitor n=1 Tax=Halalkalibacterium halodurans TaxID=86665 RepID=UPI002E214622|nr:replicative helicase loader/inhibitor [Halalkalibacterium halodurans]MED4105534.1 replicative helicase loader/inhibitor [Halalkalibacterium halodurans]MED4109260.1 replicative helicase loader/inhibitor [Halalkalibacterium halodurans]MED4149726.1 replicative helicase loader/inhibitor [Halalkalibacterium halodurans]
MDKKQTGLLLQKIDRMFPNRLKLTPELLEDWHEYMESQDYDVVIERLKKYGANNTFPPSIAHLYEEKRPEHQKYDASKIDQWEAEASGGPVQRYS